MPAAVAALKSSGQTLVILGSGELVRSLMADGLIDEYVLPIHPLTLGAGRRLFPDAGARCALELTGALTTTTGVIITTYRARGGR